MLWLLKWAIILLLVGTAWFSYQFVTNLKPEERQALKHEITGAIDGHETNNLTGPMVQKAKDDFFSGIRSQLKNLVNKLLD